MPEDNNKGYKNDEGKPRYDLLPPEALDELARVYTFGALNKPARNWELGMRWGRAFAAIMRHLWAWMRGETFDPETGFHHAAHAAFWCLALVTYDKRGLGEDDRPDVGTRSTPNSDAGGMGPDGCSGSGTPVHPIPEGFDTPWSAPRPTVILAIAGRRDD